MYSESNHEHGISSTRFRLSCCRGECFKIMITSHSTFKHGEIGSLLTVQFSHSVVSDSVTLWLQHARSPCPSPTPRIYSKLVSIELVMPSNHLILCHPLCPQSFPASGSFQMSQLFASGGQSIGVSASTSLLPMNIQDWFSLGWTGWISLQSKGLSRVFSKTIVQKHQFFGARLFFIVPTLKSIHDDWKNHSLD